MKLIKSRCFILVIGLLVGAFIGGDIALRYTTSKKKDNYVNDLIIAISTSKGTLRSVENKDFERISGRHQPLLTILFFELLDLHKSGRYTRRNDDIYQCLKETKDFMMERPDGFIEKGIFHTSFIKDRVNNPGMTSKSHARKKLQDAFDYVESLLPPLDINAIQNATSYVKLHYPPTQFDLRRMYQVRMSRSGDDGFFLFRCEFPSTNIFLKTTYNTVEGSTTFSTTETQLTEENSNNASEATSEPASSADSSVPQG